MLKVFNILPNPEYATLAMSRKNLFAWRTRMSEGMKFSDSGLGIPLKSRWDDQWELEIDSTFKNPKGLGDLAEFNRLIVANARAFETLSPLMGEAAEVLTAKHAGSEVHLFNVTKHVDKDVIGDLDDSSVFRVSPVGFYILCGPAFKDAVERSGLTGLKFREIQPTDKVPLI